MMERVKSISKKPFVKNVMIMLTGTATAQLITMFASPIVTRLYSPEALGILGVFMGVVKTVEPVSSLTYTKAIVLPEKQADAKALIRLSIFTTIISTIVVLVTVLLFNHPIVKLFRVREIAPYLYLIALVILFSGFMQVAEQWLVRTKQFKINAKASILQAFLLQGGRVGFGLVHPVSSVLVVLATLGNGVKALLLGIGAFRSEYQYNDFNSEFVPLKQVAKKYRDFPLFRAPREFITASTQGLPLILLSTFFGPASSGFYQICRSVLNMPIRILGKSVADVFYPRIAEAANKKENINSLILKATLSLGSIGIIPFGIVIAFGPELFSFVFGADWVRAGEYARWMAIWMFFSFLNRPSSRTLPVISAQLFHLKFEISSLVLRIGALFIGYYVFSSDIIAVALFGILGAILSLFLILITMYKSKKFQDSN